jgi:hypothetical protein
MRIEGGAIAELDLPPTLVIYDRNHNRFGRVTRHEFQLLGSRHAVFAVVKAKTKEVQHGKLLIAARSAQRILRHLASEFAPALSVTKPIQSRGAVKWAPRFDRAKSGHSLRVIQIATMQQSDEDYADRMQAVGRLA